MLELAKKLVDFILHIDRHLAEIIKDYGAWTYVILFGIIFAETGLVVTPFLPGTPCCSRPVPFVPARKPA